MIEKCNSASKPVYIHQQIFESMNNEPNPNRNEASDIAYSVLDGIDGVLLDTNTSEGKYPDTTCAAISRCIAEAEKAVDYK